MAAKQTVAAAPVETLEVPEAADAPEPKVAMKPSDFFNTLTGYEEIGVKKNFGDTPTGIDDAIMFVRSLVFVAERRNGHPDAYRSVMEMSVQQVSDYFLPETDGSGDAAGESGKA